MLKVYGISNCDKTKKAVTWLKKNKIYFEFHDYKTGGITVKKLEAWNQQIGWEKFFNRKSTTWRKLDKEIQDKITNEKEAIKLMTDHTSIIKRPIIENSESIVVIGFDENNYKNIFKK